jgi:NADPH:quinone reductase-like Zn-dependent oxidoreductase
MESNNVIAISVWYQNAGEIALRRSALPKPGPGFARVRTHYSGISRGTERLVLAGRVPPAEFARMRAPLQEGDFPFPVKYGYCAVGVVEDGPAELRGRTVFCLHPHQDQFLAPVGMLAVVPDGIPARRATLAANMETALNALWDSGAGPCDAIAVIGAGVVGLLVAFLAARLPGAMVTLVDVDPSRAPVARALGAGFATSENLPTECDVVFHTSASDVGIATAIACAGTEATIVEMSWFGDRVPLVPLGGAFHSRRLRLIGSQVGQVALSRRSRWDYARRLAAALDLLRDDALDVLVEGSLDLEDVPRLLPAILNGPALGLPPVIRYAGPV